MRQNNGNTQYLVQWDDEDLTETWEDEDNINPSLIRDYHLNQQINTHNQNVQNNLNLTNQQARPARLYLRVSDPTKTNNLYNRTNNQNQNQNQNNLNNGQSAIANVNGNGNTSYQNYFTNFPAGNFSIDSQKDYLLDYCYKNNYLVRSIKYDDGVSGRNPDKLKGLQETIELLQEGETLMFLDMSRFARNTKAGIDILEKLNARGVHIYSVMDGMNYDTPSARHCVRSILSTAQLESDIKGAKVKTSLQNIKNRGGHIGKAPFGYKIKREGTLRKLIEHTGEQNILRIIGNCISQLKYDNTKYKTISERLNKNKLLYRGKPFTSSNISYLAKNRVPTKYIQYSRNVRGFRN
jgi:DNA invertase Pin-like site-specific DNA recombinase